MMKMSSVDVPAYFSEEEFAKFSARLMPAINLCETTTKGSGFLTAFECKQVVPELFELADSWSDGDPLKAKAMTLIVKMGDCADTDGYLRLV